MVGYVLSNFSANVGFFAPELGNDRSPAIVFEEDRGMGTASPWR